MTWNPTNFPNGITSDGGISVDSFKVPVSASFTIGAEATNVINVAVQLTDGNGDNIASQTTFYAYLSDDADGSSLAATAPATSVAIGTDGIADVITTKLSWMLTTESDGNVDIDITETGTDTWYLVCVMPLGNQVISGAITFAA